MPDNAFPAISPPVVVGVRDIEYRIFDPDPDGSETQSMRYTAQIVWSDGTITQRAGDVVPHLTTAERNGLIALVARLRGKAEMAWGDAS